MVLVSVASPLLIWGALFLWKSHESRSAFADAASEWTQRGGTLDLASLKPAPIADDDNGGVELVEAMNIASECSSYVWQYERDAEFLTEEQRVEQGLGRLPEEVRADALAEIRGLLAQAMSKPQCQLPTNYFEAPCLQHRRSLHLANLRSIAMMLESDVDAVLSRQNLDEGDVDSIVNSLEAIRYVADAAFNEPDPGSLLICCSIEAIGFALIDRLGAIARCTEDQQRRIAACLRHPDTVERLRACVMADAATMVNEFRDPQCNEFGSITNRAMVDDICTVLIRSAMPGLEVTSPDEWRGLRLEVAETDSEEVGDLLSDWVRSQQRMFDQVLLMQSTRQLLADACSVRLIWHEQGGYPEEFESSIDPMTGRPFIYEARDGGFVLRCEGRVGLELSSVEWK